MFRLSFFLLSLLVDVTVCQGFRSIGLAVGYSALSVDICILFNNMVVDSHTKAISKVTNHSSHFCAYVPE